jgi:hypothetical protein
VLHLLLVRGWTGLQQVIQDARECREWLSAGYAPDNAYSAI